MTRNEIFEIKVKNNFLSDYRYLTLFSLVPSNCFGLELKRLRREYGKIAHRRKFDTLVMKDKKENLEREIDICEKDLERLKSDKVVVDLTR